MMKEKKIVFSQYFYLYGFGEAKHSEYLLWVRFQLPLPSPGRFANLRKKLIWKLFFVSLTLETASAQKELRTGETRENFMLRLLWQEKKA